MSARWMRGVGIVLAALAPACALTGSGDRTSPAFAAEDSLLVMAEGLAEGDVDANEALEEAGAGADVTARVVSGPRDDVTTRVSVAGASAGMRRVDDLVVGHAEWRSDGVVRRLCAGRLKGRLGEQVLVGRGFGAYPTSYSPTPAGRLTWSPSLSYVGGVDGAAMEAGAGRWRLRSIVARPPRGSTCGWAELGHESERLRFGIAAGKPLDRGKGTPAAGSLHVLRRVADVEVSGEVAHARGLFGAIRLAMRRVGAVSIFHVPALTSTAEPLVDFDAVRGVLSGVAVEWRAVTRARVRGRVLLTSKIRGDERQRRRQLWLSSHRRGHGSWNIEASLYRTSLTSETLPREEALWQTTRAHVAYTRYRLGMEVRDKRGFHRVRVDYIPGRGDGLLVAVGSRVAVGALEFEWRLAAYSLRRGQRGFIARPGPGPFELFTSVYGRGSDVALRVRCRLSRALRVFGYYGGPYVASPRVYVGAEINTPKR